MKKTPKLEKATFAAGCFWHVEELFRNVKGVKATRVGFLGGHKANPSYEQVCTGATGHAEAVEVSFDPARVSYEELLNIFWENHNPTTRNRQGPDIGEQYRSAIFYHSKEQEKAALASKAALEKSGRWKAPSGKGNAPIVTQVVAGAPAGCPFYAAEEYHQKYLAKRGMSECPV